MVTNPCPSCFTSGVLTTYDYLQTDQSMNVDDQCTAYLANGVQGMTVNTVCNTNNCNAPPAPSAAAHAAATSFVVIAAVAALAAAL